MKNMRARYRLPTAALFVVWPVACWLSTAAAAAQAACPSPVPPSVPPPNLSAPAATVVPSEVCIPTNDNSIAFFNDYSWRAFIALVWPALPKHRGEPDPKKAITDGGSLVFETYKANWETFQPDGTRPSAFNSNDSFWTSNPSLSPCPRAKPGDFLLAPIYKFGNVGLAGTGDLVSVMIAQNGTFVRYLAAYNKIEFNQIFEKELYLAERLPQNQKPMGSPIVFQNGALDIKSAWIDMKSVAHPERYHTRKAWLGMSRSVLNYVGPTLPE
ncbi:hypothetical protein [Bradyrhizobium elkanii]